MAIPDRDSLPAQVIQAIDARLDDELLVHLILGTSHADQRDALRAMGLQVVVVLYDEIAVTFQQDARKVAIAALDQLQAQAPSRGGVLQHKEIRRAVRVAPGKLH